jgi:hypothetical protein
MPSPSLDIIQLLMVLAQAFTTVPTFANGLVLLYGTMRNQAPSQGRDMELCGQEQRGHALSPAYRS